MILRPIVEEVPDSVTIHHRRDGDYRGDPTLTPAETHRWIGALSSRMSSRPRDAVSALLVAVVIHRIGRRRGYPSSALVRPGPLVLGLLAAPIVEAAFAWRPDRARELWSRPVVHLGAPALLVGLVAGVARGRRGADVVTATLGGLAGYFLLLVGVVTGILPEPATWFDRGDAR